jgi:hypothetical protein
MTLEQVLLDDYNVYRMQTQHFWNQSQDASQPWRTKDLKATEARLQLFRDMCSWCAQRNLEPRLWLYILFKSRAWRFPPKCEAGSLMSENMIPRYRSAKGLGFFSRRIIATNRPDEAEMPDPNRDLIHVVEALKERYAASGQHQRCMEELIIRTNGYHPKSKVCCACPLLGECAVRTQGSMSFDILGLRYGRITLEEAEKQAREPHAST